MGAAEVPPAYRRITDRPNDRMRNNAMSQNAEKVLDHFNLFREPEYHEMLKNKKEQF